MLMKDLTKERDYLVLEFYHIDLIVVPILITKALDTIHVQGSRTHHRQGFHLNSPFFRQDNIFYYMDMY